MVVSLARPPAVLVGGVIGIKTKCGMTVNLITMSCSANVRLVPPKTHTTNLGRVGVPAAAAARAASLLGIRTQS